MTPKVDGHQAATPAVESAKARSAAGLAREKRLKADQCGFALSSRRYPIAWRAPTLVTRAENLPLAVTSCHFRFGRVLR
jgi:hypothetical protein